MSQLYKQQVHLHLGWLTRVDDESEDEPNAEIYDIYENEEIHIGRDAKHCQIIVLDPSVSNHHVKVYSVICNDETPQAFVYALDLSSNGSYWVYRRGSRKERALIGRGNAILLSGGDRIELCDGSCFVFNVAEVVKTSEPVGQRPYANSVQEMEIDSFSNVYHMTDRQLGFGGFGRVMMAIDCFRSRQVACKIVDLKEHKRANDNDFASRVWREVDLLKDLSHPNVIHYERVFHTERSMLGSLPIALWSDLTHFSYIFEDLIPGGDVRSYLDQQNGPLANADASLIVYQILKALEYLHAQNIAHRDLKPENVLMSLPAAGARIILTDFGQSIKAVGMERMQSLVGTTDYVAPEVKGLNPLVNKTGYTKSADMWSVGALATTLYLGRSYFADPEELALRQNSELAILDAAVNCNLDALDHSLLWKDVNDQAKNLIKRLLVLQETERATVRQALAHPWFTAGDGGKSLEERYQETITGWLPSRAAQDFQEHLDIFMDAQKSIAMPPPPKPTKKTTQHKPSQPMLSEEHASPYFSNSVQRTYSSDEMFQNGKGVRPAPGDGIEDPPGSSSTKLKRTYNANTKSLGEDSTRAQTQLSEEAVGDCPVKRGKSVHQPPFAEDIPTAISETNEIALHLKVGKECKIFRSAKSFGHAVAKRRKLEVVQSLSNSPLQGSQIY